MLNIVIMKKGQIENNVWQLMAADFGAVTYTKQ